MLAAGKHRQPSLESVIIFDLFRTEHDLENLPEVVANHLAADRGTHSAERP